MGQNGGVFYWGWDFGGVRVESKRLPQVRGEIIMPYLTLDLWIAGGELLVNLHGRH